MISIANPAGTTQIAIGERETVVASVDNAHELRPWRLPIGFLHPGTTFRHEPPSALELEEAIAGVEDVVMPLARQLPSATGLWTSDLIAHRLARVVQSPGDANHLSLEEVERLFGDMAAVSLGRPAASAGVPIESALMGYVLILREFMHHLAFASLSVRDARPDQSQSLDANDAAR